VFVSTSYRLSWSRGLVVASGGKGKKGKSNSVFTVQTEKESESITKEEKNRMEGTTETETKRVEVR